MNPNVLVGVTDHLEPEEQAMLLAQYSRSSGPILERVNNPEKMASLRKQLKIIYNGDSLAKNYGHKSVGQLGHTTIFFEGVSMLAAIAIEVSELFNGQETSTRYDNFSDQPTVNFGEDKIIHWQEVWRLFYKAALGETIADLKTKYPMPEGTKEATYERTIKARAFDICGGILPAGFTTCVGFTGSFDVLNDHLIWMAYHPLLEVRELAEMAAEAMMMKYPAAAFSIEKIRERGVFQLRGGDALTDVHVESYYYRAGSFEHDKLYGRTTETQRLLTLTNQHGDHVEALSLASSTYPVVDDPTHRGRTTRVALEYVVNDNSEYGGSGRLAALRRLMQMGGSERKKYETFPRFLSDAIRFRTTSQMDFRSYRDVHRHRKGNRPLPLLVMENFIHEYYLDNLSDELREQFISLFTKQYTEFKDWWCDEKDPRQRNFIKLLQQYAIPMGAEVPYYYECDLNQLIYMLELRTDKTVHQTVRIEEMAVHAQFRTIFPGVLVHVDLDPNNFTLKRGTQTFAEVSAEVKKDTPLFSVWRGHPMGGDYANVLYDDLNDVEKEEVASGKLKPYSTPGLKPTWPPR
jgi:succinate dehydrogenase flavin-adding protein (antitoxin of CptAB toxin-antitoxin module)/thymidylate synthase ThyX